MRINSNRVPLFGRSFFMLAACGGFADFGLAAVHACTPPIEITENRMPVPGAAFKPVPASQPVVDEKDPQAKLEKALDAILPEVKFDGVGLADVIDFYRDISTTNIVVDWRAVEAAGVDRNASITLNVRNVTFRKALSLIIDQMAIGEPPIHFDFVAIDGVITISTADTLDAKTVTTQYDIRDLLAPRNADARADAKTDVKPAKDEAETRARRLEKIEKLITGSIAPRSWKTNGGRAGEISESDGHLKVVQTPENQKAILNALNQLRLMSAD